MRVRLATIPALRGELKQAFVMRVELEVRDDAAIPGAGRWP
jgi:hypothetical protein